MSNSAYDQFSFELRQFRISNDMSRAALASVLGVSASTLKQWEDGRAKVRTYKLWEVYDRLKIFADQDKSGNFEFGLLIQVFDELIENLRLANIDEIEVRQRDIDRKLSKTILRAAQTDFALSQDKRFVVPVPFTEDLELFRNNRLIDIEQLLQSIVANINDTLPHVKKSNLNSERLIETFKVYVEEANRDVPNPRILHRKGEILRAQIQDEETRSALSNWDVSALDGFVSDHQELMRLYFGEALHASQEVDRARIDDRIVPQARELLSQVVTAFDEYDRTKAPEELAFDARLPAIVVELEKEVTDYEEALSRANTPSSRANFVAKIKNGVKHAAIFVARLILRVGTFVRKSAKPVAMAVGSGAGLLAAVETVVPGSFRAIYEMIRLSFPALPPLF